MPTTTLVISKRRPLHSGVVRPFLVAAVLSEVEQLRQARQAASALEEVVANQLPCAGARLDIDTKTDRQEGLELLGQLIRLLETRGTVGRNEI